MGKKFAKFNVEGLPQGFYDDEINEVPEGSVELTDSQWIEFINNNGSRKWDGEGLVEYTPEPPETTWEMVKSMQVAVFEANSWKSERFFTQRELGMDVTEGATENAADLDEVQHMALLQYFQDVRDAGKLETPQEAADVINGLTNPTEA